MSSAFELAAPTRAALVSGMEQLVRRAGDLAARLGFLGRGPTP
jgi:hypothetical protein